MLNFDDDVVPAAQPRLMPSTPETLRAQAMGTIGGGILTREPVHDLHGRREAAGKRVHEGALRGLELLVRDLAVAQLLHLLEDDLGGVRGRPHLGLERDAPRVGVVEAAVDVRTHRVGEPLVGADLLHQPAGESGPAQDLVGDEGRVPVGVDPDLGDPLDRPGRRAAGRTRRGRQRGARPGMLDTARAAGVLAGVVEQHLGHEDNVSPRRGGAPLPGGGTRAPRRREPSDVSASAQIALGLGELELEQRQVGVRAFQPREQELVRAPHQRANQVVARPGRDSELLERAR